MLRFCVVLVLCIKPFRLLLLLLTYFAYLTRMHMAEYSKNVTYVRGTKPKPNHARRRFERRHRNTLANASDILQEWKFTMKTFCVLLTFKEQVDGHVTVID